jgi:hypothetical protein
MKTILVLSVLAFLASCSSTQVDREVASDHPESAPVEKFWLSPKK